MSYEKLFISGEATIRHKLKSFGGKYENRIRPYIF